MTDQEINLAMAEAMGWRKEDSVYVWTANGIDCTCDELWDWANDLNAIHEAEKTLSHEGWDEYIAELDGTWWKDVRHATARQCAEAFLRALGKYTE
jgi:hypothetical protein